MVSAIFGNRFTAARRIARANAHFYFSSTLKSEPKGEAACGRI
jgi:hypothetical protein